MRRFSRLLALTCLIVGSLSLSSAVLSAERINTLEKEGLFGYEPSGVAIRGYDTVAYFTQSAPVKGSESFSVDWQDATWYFASEENRALFEADPEKYAPQFGGYCAYGVAKNDLVKIEPENWSILDGKLYLNFNDKVQGLWEQDTAGFIRQANDKFDALLAGQ